MNVIKSWLLMVMAGLVWANTATAAVDPATGVSELGSARMLEQEQDNRQYRLLLSAPRKTVDRVTTSDERVLAASVWRRVWEVPGRLELKNLSANVRAALAADGGASELFSCADLSCGSSHYWANDVFGNGRLVGRDSSQMYAVLELENSTNGRQLVVLYASHRGARQTVVAMDVISTSDNLDSARIDEETMTRILADSDGWLPGMVVKDGQLDVDASSSLIAVLKRLPDSSKRRLYLLVHCYDSSNMEDNRVCSQRLADQLRMQTFDGNTQLNVEGQAALALAPGRSLAPALRFVFWPER
ncbi:DUF4892 domain-containing protein [Parathalassolituus penaei]|uniref:DUF4892 domain-containing protein n=1 Tax=Parathalassolituus penaei TaxID=2997323 RepID=A0A9X3EEQ8_9GAMM|nr:DUF4892 domain-containing protein [Parathalassolituus penaei]MCY0965850.1 DUF4892 domain-containing protein [Parathalassolituus penaei]